MLKILQAYNKPDRHEVPCEDVALTSQDFTFKNPFNQGQGEATYDAYVPFGKNVPEGTVIPGQTKCNGAFLRANPDGSGLEVYAWGLRSDFGYRFNDQGQLISSQNSGNPIPPRQVFDDWETIWAVNPGEWYGWPDYYSGLPITDERFKSPNQPGVDKSQETDFVLT